MRKPLLAIVATITPQPTAFGCSLLLSNMAMHFDVQCSIVCLSLTLSVVVVNPWSMTKLGESVVLTSQLSSPTLLLFSVLCTVPCSENPIC
jgi:hypothetical protein